MFPYSRYQRFNDYWALQKAIRLAQPGDMLELVSGTYYIGKNLKASSRSAALADAMGNNTVVTWDFGYSADGDGKAPVPATGGFIYDKHGTEEKPITICGARDTIIDGTDPERYEGSCIRVAQSSYIRVAGFTLRHCLKGLDIQGSSNSEMAYVRTENTLAEGIRLRFSSKNNVIRNSEVSNTGRLYSGWGEGIYVGTSKKNSVHYGQPEDRSILNTIRENTFGPGVQSENVDAKESSDQGNILNNQLDGRDSIGSKAGGSAWIVIRANNWTVADNEGTGLANPGAGFVVWNEEAGNGKYNQIIRNKCYQIPEGSYCVYITPTARENVVGCSNTMPDSPDPDTAPLCNCDRNCAAKRSAPVSVSSYAVPGVVLYGTTDDDRPAWLDAAE